MADSQVENNDNNKSNVNNNDNQNANSNSKKIDLSGLKGKTKEIGKSCMINTLSPKFLFIAGITISAAFIVEGLLCFTMCTVNVRSYILSLYVYLSLCVLNILYNI